MGCWYGVVRFAFPVLAGTDCLLLILSPFVSVISSRATVGLRTKRWKLFLIPEEYSPPQVLVDTNRFLEMNRQRSLDDGFMHAVFNP